MPKYIKNLTGGHKASSVRLMPNNVVHKKYDLNVPRSKKLFKKEVKCLKHLEFCDFVPKLLKYNKRSGSIFMTYVGDPAPDTPENHQQIFKLRKSLHLDWNVMRHQNNKPIYKTQSLQNCVINKDNKMFIIDFGSKKFKIVGPKVTKPILIV